MYTNKDIDKLLEKLLSSGEKQVHDICFFMLNSGLRIKEILDTKFSDINFDTGILQIGVTRSSQSNKKIKTIKLDDKSLINLARIRNRYPDDIFVFQSKNNKNQINTQARSLSLQSVINTIKQANQHSDHKLSFNSLRHAFATSYFYDTICVKNTLEHESINTTLKYIKK